MICLPSRELDGFRSRRAALAVAGLALITSAGCGARSAIEAACSTEVQPETPAVVVVFNRGMVMAETLDDGRTFSEALPQVLAQTLPDIEQVALLGAVASPAPGPSSDPQAVYPCSVAPSLGVALGPTQAEAVASYSGSLLANGPGSIAETLAVARAALDARPEPRGAAFVLLADPGDAACDATRDVQPAAVGTLAAAGIHTLVLGFTSERFLNPHRLERATLQDSAEAGGLARPDGPLRFYRADDVPAFRAALSAAVLSAYYCQGAVASGPWRDDPDAQLGAAGLPAIARSEWAWRDDAHTHLAVTGEACARIVATRATLSLIAPARRCV